MEWLVLGVAAVGGAGVFVTRRVVAMREGRRRRASRLEQVRRIADEDVTVFGEQLQRLGDAVGDRRLDAETGVDYQTALDAYERAKWDAPRLEHPDEISRLVDTLATGRYALTCVRARLAGEPVPALRVPCFFNPQHGPSAQDVRWTTQHHGTRRVPACVRCATQLAHRQQPEVRTVRIGSREVPYWEAGATLHPYSRGYFPADAATGAVGLTWMYAPAEFAPPHHGDHVGGGVGGGLDGDGNGDPGFGGFDLGGGVGGGGDGG